MNNQIQSTIAELERRISLIRNIELQWQNPIEIPIHALHIDKKSENEYLWEPLLNFKENPAIYFFEINDSRNNQIIRSEFKALKESKSRNLSKLDEKKPIETNTLYVGSVKSNLHGRLVQHLGYSNPTTGALHLAYWIDKIPNLRITFNYCIFETQYTDITELIEYAVAKEKNPLIGKEHKI